MTTASIGAIDVRASIVEGFHLPRLRHCLSSVRRMELSTVKQISKCRSVQRAKLSERYFRIRQSGCERQPSDMNLQVDLSGVGAE